MRRARIKPAAIVPIRRKPTQSGTNAEKNEFADSEKPNEKDLKQVELPTPVVKVEENVIESLVSTKEVTISKPNDQNISHNNDGLNKEILMKESHMNECHNKDELSNNSDLYNLCSNDNKQTDKINNKESDIIKNCNVQTNDGDKNIPQDLHTSHQSETSSVTSSGSPTKIIQNRSCFMRPIPRLNNNGRIRKNSIQGSGASASESEDDGNKKINTTSNRTRNDSICSIQSNKETELNTKTTEDPNSDTQKLQKAKGRRRMVISESARRLAEARRDFFLKHENKTPDRTKLTMYDLIYYNPNTNPMKRSAMNHVGRDSISQIDEMEQEEEEEENEDDPSAMPVPQVKVGPDGQLIVDEQSLVIEQTSAKKSREIQAKKAIVEEDNYGSGFYKRRPKSKEWPKWETLKFYKALNVVGTDFLLMQTLFPNRTREEIKLKYKKEEKTNRKLVEKVLKYHQEFGPESQEELAKFEELARQLNMQKDQMTKRNKTKTKRTAREKRMRRLSAASIGEMEASDYDESTEPEETKTDEKSTETNNNQRAKKRSKVNNDKSGDNISEGESEESISLIVSDSDTEVYEVRPTRSGRSPVKVRKLQGPDINNLHSTNHSREKLPDAGSETHKQEINNSDKTAASTAIYPEVINSAIPDISQIEPGSVVILSKGSSEEPGETVLQVYMVSSNGNSSDEQIAIKSEDVIITSEIASPVKVASDVQSLILEEEQEGN